MNLIDSEYLEFIKGQPDGPGYFCVGGFVFCVSCGNKLALAGFQLKPCPVSSGGSVVGMCLKPDTCDTCGDSLKSHCSNDELHDLRVCFCKVTIQRHMKHPDDWSLEQAQQDKKRWPKAFEQAAKEKDFHV